MKKSLAIVGLLALVATPAFAQSFDPGMGTGNVLPFSYEPTTQDGHPIARTEGNNAFAMAPRPRTNFGPYSPAATGGGSDGYNWGLVHNY